MFVFALLLLAGASQSDTLRLSAEDALQRTVATSAVLEASRRRVEVAARELDRTRVLSNPGVSVAAENVGSMERMGGVGGAAGLEGQAVLTGLVPLGGDRRAAVARAEAERSSALEGLALTEADVRYAALRAIAEAERDSRMVAHVLEERADLERFAALLALGVAEGRFPAGHAARAELAAVQAGTEAARRVAAAAGSAAELARVLGVAPRTRVRVEVPACLAGGPAVAAQLVPEERIAQARVEAAVASVALTRARAVPDLHPQIGVRRNGGGTGLYLGFAVELPTFDRGGAAIAAARAEQQAVRAEAEEVTRRLDAERVAAEETLRSLEAAGSLFNIDWTRALERSVTAARTGYELGDGTLTELLDARRARLAALDDHARWEAEVRIARARAARLSGVELTASLICTSDYEVPE